MSPTMSCKWKTVADLSSYSVHVQARRATKRISTPNHLTPSCSGPNIEWISRLIKYISELNIQPHRAIIMDSITTFSLSPPEFHEGSHSPTLVSFDNSWIPEPCFFVAATFETWYFVQSPRRLQTLADLNVGPNESIHDHIRLRHYSA